MACGQMVLEELAHQQAPETICKTCNVVAEQSLKKPEAAQE
jgi:hypothetical protein